MAKLVYEAPFYRIRFSLEKIVQNSRNAISMITINQGNDFSLNRKRHGDTEDGCVLQAALEAIENGAGKAVRSHCQV